jgi:ABC-type uncharacterized transport system substrate-binding protein
MSAHSGPRVRAFLATIVALLAVLGMSLALVSPQVEGARAKWKILHIMSYHSPWEWTDEQLRGFKDALRGVDAEYRVFQMDTKRRSSAEWKATVSREARQLIDTWQPDLVYTNDDLAQELVARHYVNTAIPFVFSGVNADPGAYGFAGSKNVAGVLEQEHFVQSVHLLKDIVPTVRRVAVILDNDPTWTGVVRRMKQQAQQLPGVEFVSWDVIGTFEEYKSTLLRYQGRVDAVALLGIFTFKDSRGGNVPYEDVLKWTAQHSPIPDFSFWESRIGPGTLCVVTVSGYEQGLAAGRIARGILVEGRSPASFAMEPTVKGEPMISLARARKLGIQIKTSVLLTARVVERFDWDTEGNTARP